jgi:hypothetical protein
MNTSLLVCGFSLEYLPIVAIQFTSGVRRPRIALWFCIVCIISYLTITNPASLPLIQGLHHVKWSVRNPIETRLPNHHNFRFISG